MSNSIVLNDEWGDEGVWYTAIDFTKKENEGISLKKLLGLLHRI
jgi:hypothetical protein